MSRTVTLWGYAVLGVAAVVCQAACLLLRQTSAIGPTLTRLKRVPLARAVLLGSWLWLGWHTFVRSG